MPDTLAHILPSLESLGLWSYWIIGLAALLEAFFVTGVIVPGTLMVEAGGVLVQQGALDFFDLVWFVAIGSILGGEIGFWVGRLAKTGLKRRWQPEQSAVYQRAARLFQRHGGMALVIGRFLGPVSGLVPFAAALAGVDRRKFVIWNIISGFPYAFGQIALGYFLWGVIVRLGPMATRLLVFAAVAALVLGILWYLIVRIERMLPFVRSVLRSIFAAVGENQDVQAWAAKHPHLARFLAARVDTRRFGGLTSTLLGAILLYLLALWLATVLDVVLVEPVLQTDINLANLIHAFWTPGLLRFFSAVTALGDWRVVGLVLVGTCGLLFYSRRRDLVLGLVTALLGDVVTVTILKLAFHRPRPALAYYVETSGSFPSGHAAVSVAFFGMLFYILWRLRVLGPISSAILAATVAFMIGLSRLYLIEHYLTDVLNGFLVGGIWLVIGIAVAERWAETRRAEASPPQPPARKFRNLITALVAGVMLLGTGWIMATYNKPLNARPIITKTETITNIPALFKTGKAAPYTESVAGTPLEPISIVIIAKNNAAFEGAMAKAGWIRAEKPGVLSLTRAAWAAWTNSEDKTAPVTPYFWDGKPNTYGFQRPTPANTLRKRHHARFWNTRFLAQNGWRIYVGTASFDDGLDYWGVLHHIDPNIDAERNILTANLKSAGVVARNWEFQLSTPHLGQDVAGDPWFTDGKAVIIWLK